MTSSQKLCSPAVCLGTFISSGSSTVAELASLCGLDWLMLDMEHGALTEAGLLDCLRATAGRDVVSVVRVPTHEAGLISRVLDRGAHALMAPHVESAEQAESLVRAMCYAPTGDRGYSRTVRAYGYGLVVPESVERPLLFAQIESVAGVEHVEAIAKVPGVDVLFVGPADLKLSLAAHKSAITYEDALARVLAATKSAGIHTGILARDRADVPKLLAMGFSKVAVDSDLALLRAGFASIKTLA
jgi:2-dehydro-3-deoxyglucarate aldolase/4-hydroxy-2-oxoheptanedioate aldolase